MNKARRKEIASIVAVLRDAAERLEFTGNEEQEALDNLPESLQSTERAEAMERAIEEISNAVNAIQEAIDAIEEL